MHITFYVRGACSTLPVLMKPTSLSSRSPLAPLSPHAVAAAGARVVGVWEVSRGL